MAEDEGLDDSVGEIEAVESEIDSKQQETNKQEEIEPKYRGKSVEDIIRMHKEAEGLIDRQSKEVGEIRKLADELIRSQLTPKPEKEPQPEVDFFANPDEAIRRAVESNPKVLQAEQYALMAQREMAKQRFNQMHPDANQIIQDPEFVSYVKSSKVRTKLFQEANNYDLDAADELLSTFKQLKAVKQSQVSDVEKQSRTKSMQSASVETGGSGESGKKVYSRKALINLRIKNPSKFDAMKSEIDAAYREGRIKP